jgi:hypothetical protein
VQHRPKAADGTGPASHGTSKNGTFTDSWGDRMTFRYGFCAFALIAAACGDSTAPESPTRLTLSVTAPDRGIQASAVPGLQLAVTQTDGENTLVLDRVALVLRQIELKRALAVDCDNEGSGSEDDCEEFETGPLVLEIPTNGAVTQVVAIDVPPDLYDELEFDVHKPGDDSPEDVAFLQAHPEFVDVSVLVEGSWNGQAFSFTQDLNEEQEIDLAPPLEVTADSGPANLTLEIDISTWFARSDGTLIDPSTANKGEPNEGLVEANIRRSIAAFEDDDKDGDRDDDKD